MRALLGMVRLLLTLTMLGLAGGCASAPADPSTTPGAESIVASTPAAPTHPELRADLLDLRDRDQAARRALIEMMQDAEPGPDGRVMLTGERAKAMQAMMAIDAESTAFLKETIAAHGWPTVTMVGEDGAGAAWLLAQHADADPALQAEVLERMRPLVDAGEARPSDFALLTDRVLVARGEPQRYGTQFGEDAEGVMRPQPIADIETVDERRAAMGLPPLAAYARRLAESYGRPASTEPLD